MSGRKMSKLRIIVNSRIGLRTFLKSAHVYSKTKAGNNGRGLSAFLVDGNTKLLLSKNINVVNMGSFWFGIDLPERFQPTEDPSLLQMLENSKLIINGEVLIGSGASIRLYENATLEIGNKVAIDSRSKIFCARNIKIGDNSLISWEVEIRDTDYHRVIRSGYEVSKPIEIGNHVWIGSRVTILKGVTIGGGSVVACGSVVNRSVPENCLVAGVPARIKRNNILWGK